MVYQRKTVDQVCGSPASTSFLEDYCITNTHVSLGVEYVTAAKAERRLLPTIVKTGHRRVQSISGIQEEAAHMQGQGGR